jgi:uracil-DNA glycosylase
MGSRSDATVDALLADIRACTVCADALAAGPRPVVQFSSKSRLVIIGQAPGARVHASGIPWQDDSGDRLRDWTGLTADEFYDPEKIALVPIGFCYPGSAESGDLPPRRECAPLWHDRIFATLKRRRLTLLVGSYAQARYLAGAKRQTLTHTVLEFRSHGPEFFPLPHPSWRSGIWMKRNPWFEASVLPALRPAVRRALSGR